MIHYDRDGITLHHGDCLDVLRELPDCSVDAVVTDPPYGLEFMGKAWDRFDEDSKARAGLSGTGYTDGAERLERPSHMGGLNPKCRTCGRWQRGGNPCACETPDFPNERRARSAAFGDWCFEWATEALRVLKPGGHMLAFGGTRTWHRLACAVEDAGFEIRDSIAWLYGSGFPKSLDVSKAIDKAAGAEREVVGQADRKSGPGRHMAALAGNHGESVTPDITAPATDAARTWQGWGTALKPAFEPVVVARKPLRGTVAANVLAWGTGALNIDGCRIGSGEGVVTFDRAPRAADGDVYDLGTVTGVRASGAGRWPANVTLDESQAAALDRMSGDSTSTTHPRGVGMGYHGGDGERGEVGPADSGGASRYFKVVSSTTMDPCQQRGDASTRAESTSAGRRAASSGDSLPTDGYGNRQTDPSRPDTTSTTATTTPSTTTPRTLCCSPQPSTETTTDATEKIMSSSTAPSTDDASDVTHTCRCRSSQSDGPEPSRDIARTVSANTCASGGQPTETSTTPTCGCTAPADQPIDDLPSRFFYTAKAPGAERVKLNGTAHPTVKPLDLMRWLVRLVTPPGGVVLEPFAGSGTTVEAAILEGFNCIAIEREADYLPLIMQRIHRQLDPVAAVQQRGDDGGLFDLLENDGGAA